jgi:hypothetical protein
MAVSKFWSNSRVEQNRRYILSELIDTEILVDESQSTVQIICDIDKTYIETKFESAVSMIKIAFEQADEKVTVTGASIALMAARWGDLYQVTSATEGTPRPLHFLSASPPQLRKVIREKLALDGLDWTSDTFKNQAYNIKMGKLKLLKQHVAYKTATILAHMSKAPAGSRFILIGDNAELDAYIYAGVHMFLDKTLSRRAYQDYLSSGGVDREVLETLDPYLSGSFDDIRVKGILIRRAPGYSFIEAKPLTDLVIAFDHYFEVALHFLALGLIADSALWSICRQLHNSYAFQREELIACLKAAIRSFQAEGRSVESLQDALNRLGRRIPLADWPERKNLFPGKRLEKVELSESAILEAAYAWVQAIARRDSK